MCFAVLIGFIEWFYVYTLVAFRINPVFSSRNEQPYIKDKNRQNRVEYKKIRYFEK